MGYEEYDEADVTVTAVDEYGDVVTASAEVDSTTVDDGYGDVVTETDASADVEVTESDY
jgi:hypothetical protein